MYFAYASWTDRGDVRAENQDSILCLTGEIAGNPAGLFVVADGMGGLSYGTQISSFITEQFESWWELDFPQMLLAGRNSEEDLRELLEQEIWDINQAVLRFREEQKCRSGSTLSVLLLYRENYYIVHIGDSRIYRLGADTGKLEQLTVDQSLAAQLVREHRLTETDAGYSSRKSILTMCVGMFDVPKNFYSCGTLQKGDCFLLCSDGLHNALTLEELEYGLRETTSGLHQKPQRLRSMIGAGRASDNVSVIVVEIL